MSVYKMGKRPAFMDRTSGALVAEEISQAVASMSFDGLQMAAALGLTFATRTGHSPSFIDETLAEMDAGFNKKLFQE